MSRHRSFLTFLLLLSLCYAPLAQQPAPNAQSVNIKTSEVLLDVLVHDKKGRPVRDLKPEELEVYEDGVKQNVTQFEVVSAATNSARKSAATTDSTANATEQAEVKPLNLVTLLFDHLNSARTQPVRDAGFTFIDNSVTPEMRVRVMVVGKRLYAIEQFTSDKAKLRKAVERATNTVEKSFADISNRIADELKLVAESATASKTDTLLAKVTLDTLSWSERMYNETKNPMRILSMLPFARAQRQAPGRKMTLYFSDGLYMPAGFDEAVRSAVSEANRANVSFYAVNVRNLLVGAGNISSRLETGTVINQTRRQESATYNSDNANSFSVARGGERPTTNFNTFEVIDRNKELNKRGPLADLSEGTGGFLLNNQNDLNGAMKKVASELSNYYALSYLPSRQEYDGKFRAITVKVLRPGLQAQTRNGYFAVPPAAGAARPVLSFEAPLLAALNSAVVPRDFPTRVGTLRFKAQANEVHEAVLLELPLAALLREQAAPAPAKDAKPYALSFAILGLLKDEKGEVVQRFSEPHQMEIPAAALESAKVSSFTLTRHFWLAPGRYTLEFAVHDQKTDRISAQRRAFTIAPPKVAPLQTSSLFLVKQVESVDEQTADTDNPFITERKKIVPDLNDEIVAGARADLSFYLALFPDAQAKTEPTLKLLLLRDGKVVAATTPKLPKPGADGRIHFTAGMPTAGLPSGRYQFHAIATQGTTTTEEFASFTVTGGHAASAPVTEEKTITSTLAAADKIGELTLSALKTVQPIDVKLDELIAQVADVGARSYGSLGDYTYSLRKVRRLLTPQGRIKSEQYQDYEAYPVRGRHALIQLAENGTTLAINRIDLNRRSATNALIKNEEDKQAIDKKQEEELNRKVGYWGASVEGQVQKRGQPRRNVYLTLDPDIFLQWCEFSSPRSVTLAGRPTIVLNFTPRPDVKLELDKDWARQMVGTLWIDAAEKALVRVEGQAMPAQGAEIDDNAPINFIYQQQRLAAGVWAPSLVRINAAGDETVFRGLNWDAWFEFTNFKRFDAHDSDVKINAPEEKKR